MGAHRWVYLFAIRLSSITSHSYRGSAGRHSPTIQASVEDAGSTRNFFGAPLRNKRRNARSGAFSAFRVSEWSVRRKVVAVLAIPVILAAVFGGLRVSTELHDASTYSISQQRATVLGPAVAYLTATERLALPASLSDQLSADGGDDAVAAYTTAADTLQGRAADAGLTVTQNRYVT